eukprot:1289397-Prymnesium_polylepis.1
MHCVRGEACMRLPLRCARLHPCVLACGDRVSGLAKNRFSLLPSCARAPPTNRPARPPREAVLRGLGR